MDRRNHVAGAAILFTLALFGFASFYPLESMWGFNHLHFLPAGWSYAYWIVAAVIVWTLYLPFPETRAEQIFAGVDRWLFGPRMWPRLLVAGVAMTVFYVFRVQTHLLGDGYTWLAVFGQGEAYIHKWAEPGYIALLRVIQRSLGGYTRETALHAFQIMSVVAGGIFVYGTLLLIPLLARCSIRRVLAVATLFLSGGMLLFFGYVEFYSLVWAAVVVYIYFSLRTFRFGWSVLPAFGAFVAALLLHVQSIVLVPGLCYLLISRIQRPKCRKAGYIVMGLGVLASAALLVWLYRTQIAIEVLILPLWQGRPVAPDYTVFSTVHLWDIVNLVLLVLPSLLVMFVFAVPSRRFRPSCSAGSFLALCSLGSIIYLVLFGAAITMGRDWDVMAIGLLSPTIHVLYCLQSARWRVSGRAVVATGLATATVTLCFLSVAIQSKPSEDRFYTLLNERSQNGWVILANHFLLEGNRSRHDSLMREIATRFPLRQELHEAYRFLESGRVSEARKLAIDLVEADPYEAALLQFMGNLYRKTGPFDSAESYYVRALQLHPYQATTMNELGQLYMQQRLYPRAIAILREAHSLAPEKTFITEGLGLAHIYMQHYDSALALADTLFMTDPDSPGAHLLSMTVALRGGDQVSARQHLQEYLKYGRSRSDYDRIRKYYGYLLNGW
ncbi:MAG: tetratricopeptide repeat protein [Candidatus Zixiibacteriota bacterium]